MVFNIQYFVKGAPHMVMYIRYCDVMLEYTCWLDFLAYLGPESSVYTITVLPFVLLVLQSILEGILSTCSRSNRLPSLPLSLKLTAIGEV